VRLGIYTVWTPFAALSAFKLVANGTSPELSGENRLVRRTKTRLASVAKHAAARHNHTLG
jgi:hypothetical protein